jgi:hypothetical protein
MVARVRRWSNGRSAALDGDAQPIARCCEGGGVGRRSGVAERLVRAVLVVISEPSRDGGTRLDNAEMLRPADTPLQMRRMQGNMT